jgi:hypothetical protein
MGLVTGILIGCVFVVIGYFLWCYRRSLRAWLFATRRGPDNRVEQLRSSQKHLKKMLREKLITKDFARAQQVVIDHHWKDMGYDSSWIMKERGS